MIFRKILHNFTRLFFKKKLEQENLINKRIHNTVLFYNSSLDKYSYISPNCTIDSCSIGKYCSIGPNTVIGYGDHPANYMSTSPMFYYSGVIFDKTFAKETNYNHHKKVEIKNDVWVGSNVYIKNGVTIGNGAIIGAGSIIIKDIPDYAIFVGTPGKLLKYRFNEVIIEKLLTIKWWDLEEDLLHKYSSYLNCELTEELLDEFIILISK